MVQINWYTLVIKRPKKKKEKKLITFSFGTCICICSEAIAACAVVRPLAVREGEPPASAYRKMHQNQAKAKQSIPYLKKETTTKIPSKCTERKEKQWNLCNDGTYKLLSLIYIIQCSYYFHRPSCSIWISIHIPPKYHILPMNIIYKTICFFWLSIIT